MGRGAIVYNSSMRGSDVVLIVLTFVTGLFCGAYLYITVFAPEYRIEDDVLNVEETDFALMGEMYGGCERQLAMCDLFALDESRSYHFTAGYAFDEREPDPIKGTLPRDVYEQLHTALEVADFSALQSSGSRCVSQVDGNDYRYRLIYEGEEYFLDTCATQFTDSALAKQFLALWPVVSTPTTLLDEASAFDLKDEVESMIDGWFTYDDE